LNTRQCGDERASVERVQRWLATVAWCDMQLGNVPGLGVIGYLDREVYLRDKSERELPLAMQHRLALRRLGALIEDQLGASPGPPTARRSASPGGPRRGVIPEIISTSETRRT
jgi:hypothetical protein